MSRFLLSLCSVLALSLGSAALAQSEDDRSVRELNTLMRINPVSEEALAALIAKAEAGDVDAMMAVYGALNAGLGAPRDRDAARGWLERAAATGESPRALTTLGNVLRSRDDDLEGARALWREAADAGQISAMLRLAEFDPIEFGTRIQNGLVANGEPISPIDGILGPISLGALAAYLDKRDIDPTICADQLASSACLNILARSGLFAAQ